MIAPSSARTSTRPRVLFAGALPPPHHGCTIVTRNILESSLAERFELVHLDIADRRSLENIGRLDLGNVWLAGVHGARFARLLAVTRPHLVYLMIAQNTWGFLRDTLFMAPPLLRDLPLVLHFHTGQFDDFYAGSRAPLRALIRSLVGRADRSIVLGESLRAMLDGIVPPARIDVLPNGVPDLTGGVREARPPKIRALYLGNLMPGKGYLDVVAAAEQLLAEGRDLDVIFAGNVSDPAAHRMAEAAAKRWPGRLQFTGSVDAERKAELLRTCDFLVFPSYKEGHPLVVLEAMAAGMPVIGSRCVAIADTIIHGETGLLVEPQDLGGLAAAMRALSEDAALRTRMGEAGRARYLEQYTLTAWAERLGTVLEDALAARTA